MQRNLNAFKAEQRKSALLGMGGRHTSSIPALSPRAMAQLTFTSQPERLFKESRLSPCIPHLM
jgi:hypothetical protein